MDSLIQNLEKIIILLVGIFAGRMATLVQVTYFNKHTQKQREKREQKQNN